jgi:hypothetical protein
MLLLSTAADLYWLGRYLTRAQELLTLLVAAFTAPSRENLTIPLSLTATGSYYYQQYTELKQAHLASFFSDEQNMSSVTSCITAIRADAQATRGYLPNQIWLAVNGIYLEWQAHLLTQKDQTFWLGSYQKLKLQLDELSEAIASQEQQSLTIFVGIGQHIEGLDTLLRHGLVKQTLSFDYEQALIVAQQLQAKLELLPSELWQQAQNNALVLSRLVIEQEPILAIQQQLQALTKALADVFAR